MKVFPGLYNRDRLPGWYQKTHVNIAHTQDLRREYFYFGTGWQTQGRNHARIVEVARKCDRHISNFDENLLYWG